MQARWLVLGVAFALALLGVDAASPRRLVGANKCTWGPSYWCQALPQSAKCGATSHCIEKVWSENPYPADDDQVCKICKDMVQQARDQLESNETQTEIKEVFEGSCDLIPIKLIAEECKKLADEFVVELVETLASEMNPDTVCAVAGLCNSARIDAMLEKYQAGLLSAAAIAPISGSGDVIKTDCDICREQTSKLSLQVRLMDKRDIMDRALQLCGKLNSYSDACKLEVLNNFNDIYDALTHLEPVCDLVGMCSETFSDVPSSLAVYDTSDPTQKESLECEFCEKVIHHWIDQWKANATQEEFKEVLESLCKELGQPERIDRCLHIVDDYYIPLFNFILNELDAHQICTIGGLCKPTAGFLQVDPELPLTIMLPHDSNPRVLSAALGDRHGFTKPLIGGYFMPQSAQEMIKPGCVLCEFVMYRLREWIQDEHTRDDISYALHKVCSEAPASLKDQCNNLVAIYEPAIVELIIRDADPKTVCNLIQVCIPNSHQLTGTAGEEQLPQQLTAEEQLELDQSPIAIKKKQDQNCATCQYVLAIVMDGINNKDNQDEIRNVLESVCNLIPSESAAIKCEQLVSSYAESIIDLIAQNLTPDQICQAVGLCATPPALSQSCIVCKWVVQQVDSVLEDKSEVDKIIAEMDKACVILYDENLKKECRQFVETYTPAVVDLIANGATPEQICQFVGLCEAQTPAVQPNDPVSPPEMVVGVEDNGDSGTCTICQFLVKQVDDALEDPTDVEEVKDFLEKVCTYLPSDSMKQQCKTFVDTYTAAILDLIAQGASPKEVCQELGLCDGARGVMVMGEVLAESDEDSMEEAYEDDDEDDSSEEDDDDDDDYDDYEYVEEVEVMEAEEKPYCLMCEYAISEAESMIADKKNQEEVRQALDKVCYKFSSPMTRACLDFVDNYIDKIVYMFTNDYTPEKVCTALRMCSKATDAPATSVDNIPRNNDISSPLNRSPSHPSRVGGNGPVCTICEFGMEYVEKQILTNRTLDMVERSVLMMCSYLPWKLDEKCEEFVEQYGDQIIDLIIHAELDPQQVCAEIGLCSAARTWDATVVGGNVCNFGPALWCQSKFHMKQCGTARFCNTSFGRNFNN